MYTRPRPITATYANIAHHRNRTKFGWLLNVLDRWFKCLNRTNHTQAVIWTWPDRMGEASWLNSELVRLANQHKNNSSPEGKPGPVSHVSGTCNKLIRRVNSPCSCIVSLLAKLFSFSCSFISPIQKYGRESWNIHLNIVFQYSACATVHKQSDASGGDMQ